MSATTTRFGSGQAVQRLEDDQLLKGEGVYAADVVPQGQTRLCFVRSPYAHARLVSVDTSEAEKMPGVRLVLSGPALAAKGVKPMPRAMNFTRADGSPLAAACASGWKPRCACAFSISPWRWRWWHRWSRCCLPPDRPGLPQTTIISLDRKPP